MPESTPTFSAPATITAAVAVAAPIVATVAGKLDGWQIVAALGIAALVACAFLLAHTRAKVLVMILCGSLAVGGIAHADGPVAATHEPIAAPQQPIAIPVASLVLSPTTATLCASIPVGWLTDGEKHALTFTSAILGFLSTTALAAAGTWAELQAARGMP